MSSLNPTSMFLLHIHTQNQNYYLTSLRNRMQGWEVSPITLLKLPENWVICIEKGCLNDFAQVITILSSLYWKHCQLLKKC